MKLKTAINGKYPIIMGMGTLFQAINESQFLNICIINDIIHTINVNLINVTESVA